MLTLKGCKMYDYEFKLLGTKHPCIVTAKNRLEARGRFEVLIGRKPDI